MTTTDTVLGLGQHGLCANCPHSELLTTGACVPGDACVRAHSGRQIDRFLKANPQHAERYLRDSFWERRAIAVRYAPIESVLALQHDGDEVVRRAVVMRLPPDQLKPMAKDQDREVRITVAQRIDPDMLLPMASDPDYMVRVVVARRLSTASCPSWPTTRSGKYEKPSPSACRPLPWPACWETLNPKYVVSSPKEASPKMS